MQAAQTLHILHLEDELSLREITRTTIMVLDPYADIHQCSDSDEALAYLERSASALDLLILDVRVPGSVDGIGVALRARAHGCEGLIAFTSAYPAPARNQVVGLEYLWYSKPVELQRMRALLQSTRQRMAARG